MSEALHAFRLALFPQVVRARAASFMLALLFISLGAACCVGCAIGMHNFWQSAYFYSSASNAMCTVTEFVGLASCVFLATPGVTLLFTGVRSLYWLTKDHITVCVLGVLVGLAFAAIAITGWLHVSWDIARCGVAFCVDMSSWVEISGETPAGHGFKAVVTLAAFFSMLPAGLIFSFGFLSPYFQRLLAREEGEERLLVERGNSNGLLGPSPFSSRSARLVMLLTFALFLVGFGFVTLYVPNSWEYFTAFRIARNAMMQMTMNYTMSNNLWQSYATSEYPWAVMTTANWEVGRYLIIKLYPSNIIFYFYLLCVLAITAILIVSDRYSTPVLSKRWGFTLPHFVGGQTAWSVQQIGATLLTIGATILFFFYWIHDHNYNSSWTGGNNPDTDNGIHKSERYARAAGQLAVFFMGLLFFPASRWSVLHHALGTSWESFLWAHRILGYSMLGAGLAHMIAWWVKMHEVGTFPHDILSVPMTLAESQDNFTVPLVTITFFVTIIAMGVLTFEPIRRHFFEVFYYSHLFAAYALIPAVLWHAAAGWEYLVPGLSVWFIDRMIRLFRSSRKAELTALEPIGHDAVKLVFKQRGLHVRAGQYVFINIPPISLFEWHPFTVVGGSEAAGYTLMIRGMAKGTWTRRLLHAAHDYADLHHTESGSLVIMNDVASKEKASPAKQVLPIHVDGPYGHSFDFSEYDHVRLLCGGIGVTPCAAIFGSIAHHHPDVTMDWTIREACLVSAVLPFITSTESTARIHLTHGARPKDLPLDERHKTQLLLGRPKQMAHEAMQGTEEGRTLVFCCGPVDAVAHWETEVKAVQHSGRVNFHSETFFL